jgi:hypothetical protein
LTISDVADPRPDAEIDVLALHEALEVLAAKDADLARSHSNCDTLPA